MQESRGQCYEQQENLHSEAGWKKMSIALEIKKTKRTGFWPAFAAGGILAAAVPIVNMAVRSDQFTGTGGNPLNILIQSNWQMMAMLHMFLMTIGACLLYHTEYADNAMQKMEMLPMSIFKSHIFKALILVLAGTGILLLETAAFIFCTYRWFEVPEGFWLQLLKNMGFSAAAILPVIFTVSVTAYICRNMWTSLGACVICICVVSVIPQMSSPDSAFALFPFALPYQSFVSLNAEQIRYFLCAAVAETILAAFVQGVFLRIRRAAA